MPSVRQFLEAAEWEGAAAFGQEKSWCGYGVTVSPRPTHLALWIGAGNLCVGCSARGAGPQRIDNPIYSDMAEICPDEADPRRLIVPLEHGDVVLSVVVDRGTGIYVPVSFQGQSFRHMPLVLPPSLEVPAA